MREAMTTAGWYIVRAARVVHYWGKGWNYSGCYRWETGEADEAASPDAPQCRACARKAAKDQR